MDTVTVKCEETDEGDLILPDTGTFPIVEDVFKEHKEEVEDQNDASHEFLPGEYVSIKIEDSDIKPITHTLKTEEESMDTVTVKCEETGEGDLILPDTGTFPIVEDVFKEHKEEVEHQNDATHEFSPGEYVNIKVEDSDIKPITHTLKTEDEHSMDTVTVKCEEADEGDLILPDTGTFPIVEDVFKKLEAHKEEVEDQNGASHEFSPGEYMSIKIEEKGIEPVTTDTLETEEERDLGMRRRHSLTCSICKKSFTYKCYLKRHLETHGTQRCFNCDICNKSFSRKDGLKIHQLIHSGVRLFKCDICNKSFPRKHNFKNHQLIHSGLRVFKCDICNKSFNRKDKLKTHHLIHTGLRMFKCDICKKSFNRKANLRKHQLIHSSPRMLYKCDICNKSFSYKDNLKYHQLIHTDPGVFKCDICNKSFLRKDHFKNHQLVHSSQQLFKCDICEKSFTRKANFKKHQLVCHSDLFLSVA